MEHLSDSEDSSPSQSLHSHSSSISDFQTLSTARSELFDTSPAEFWDSDAEFIAVVGGLGYIGSHTCLELLKAGHNIIIIDNLSNAFRGVYDRIGTLAKRYYDERCRTPPIMQFYEADYRDELQMRDLFSTFIKTPSFNQFFENETKLQSRIKGVIHFAAYKSVVESIHHPLKYYGNNVAGLIEFCSVLNDFNIKTLIFSSSATVYGSTANSGLPLREEFCTHKEESFINDQGVSQTTQGGCTGLMNPYGRTKWMCEAILSDLAYADPEWTIVALRYFNPVGCDESGLLGEDPRGVPTNLIPVVVRVLTGQMAELKVFGTDYPTPDGTAVRDFIHVTDLARGHLAALSAASDGRIPKGFRTYNLGTGEGQSVYQVVKAIEAVSSTKIPIQTVDRRAGDVGICVAMPTRAEKELDWKTEKSLEISCRDVCNYLDYRKKALVAVD